MKYDIKKDSLTDIEKIYFNNQLTQMEKVYKIATFLHDKGQIHQQLYFAICDLYKENEGKNEHFY